VGNLIAVCNHDVNTSGLNAIESHSEFNKITVGSGTGKGLVVGSQSITQISDSPVAYGDSQNTLLTQRAVSLVSGRVIIDEVIASNTTNQVFNLRPGSLGPYPTKVNLYITSPNGPQSITNINIRLNGGTSASHSSVVTSSDGTSVLTSLSGGTYPQVISVSQTDRLWGMNIDLFSTATHQFFNWDFFGINATIVEKTSGSGRFDAGSSLLESIEFISSTAFGLLQNTRLYAVAYYQN
jgi:uncharacterized protein with PQ loop repeat